MNSENSKTCDPHRLLLNLTDKINLKRSALSNLRIYYTWENIKEPYKNKGIKRLNYLMYHILYQAFKITLNTS